MKGLAIDASDEWRRMCLKIANRMEDDGDTSITQLLGTALQTHVHRLNGDNQQADAADQRRAALSEALAETAEVLDAQIFLHNPQLISRYLGILTSYGEAEAAEFIKKEYARYRKVFADRCSQ